MASAKWRPFCSGSNVLQIRVMPKRFRLTRPALFVRISYERYVKYLVVSLNTVWPGCTCDMDQFLSNIRWLHDKKYFLIVNPLWGESTSQKQAAWRSWIVTATAKPHDSSSKAIKVWDVFCGFISDISLDKWQTMVSPAQLCWRYYNLPLSQRYVLLWLLSHLTWLQYEMSKWTDSNATTTRNKWSKRWIV